MPVERVGTGWRWGKKGKVYYGKGAREKAEAQGRAAYAAGYGKDKKSGKKKAAK